MVSTFLFGLVVGANLAWVFTSLRHAELRTELRAIATELRSIATELEGK